MQYTYCIFLVDDVRETLTYARPILEFLLSLSSDNTSFEKRRRWMKLFTRQSKNLCEKINSCFQALFGLFRKEIRWLAISNSFVFFHPRDSQVFARPTYIAAVRRTRSFRDEINRLFSFPVYFSGYIQIFISGIYKFKYSCGWICGWKANTMRYDQYY